MATSAYYECLSAVKTALETLLSPGDIAAASIVIDEVALPRDRVKPFIAVSPVTPEANPGGSASLEKWGYGILVAYVADPDVASLDARLTIRQKIRRRFHYASLSGITLGTLMQTVVEPSAPVDIQAYLQNHLFVSAVVVRCEVREAKT